MGEWDDINGPVLIGALLNTFLYGLVSCQYFQYYQTQCKDGWALKCLVIILHCIDTLFSASLVYMVWAYMVTHYNDFYPEVLWPTRLVSLTTTISATVTQAYLSWRIWQLSRSRILFGIIIVWTIAYNAIGVVCVTQAFTIESQLTESDLKVAAAWYALQVIADTLITGTLITILVRKRSNTYRRSSLLNRLVRNAVQSGLIAEICAIPCTFTFFVWPDKNIYGVFAYSLGRVYSLTFMNTLLSRAKLRSDWDGRKERNTQTLAPEFTTVISVSNVESCV